MVVPVLLLAGACGDDESADTSGTVQSDTVTSLGPVGEPTTERTGPSTSVAGTVPPLGEVQLTEVARLDRLGALAAHPASGRLFVAQRDGLVSVVDPDTGEVGEPVLDMRDRTEASGE